VSKELKKQKIVELANSGLTYAEIAAEIGCGIGDVHYWCKQAGIVRQRGRPKSTLKNVSVITKEGLETLAEKGLNSHQMARYYKMPERAVVDLLLKSGLPTELTWRSNGYWCSICGDVNPVNFSPQNKRYCRDCYLERKQQGDWKGKKRTKLLERFGCKCGLCGYDEIPEILEFHHVDRKDKVDNISAMITHNSPKLEEELSKCVLVCPTCHSVLHFKENGKNGCGGGSQKTSERGEKILVIPSWLVDK
jgi:hypothetical protein